MSVALSRMIPFQQIFGSTEDVDLAIAGADFVGEKVSVEQLVSHGMDPQYRKESCWFKTSGRIWGFDQRDFPFYALLATLYKVNLKGIKVFRQGFWCLCFEKDQWIFHSRAEDDLGKKTFSAARLDLISPIELCIFRNLVRYGQSYAFENSAYIAGITTKESPAKEIIKVMKVIKEHDGIKAMWKRQGLVERFFSKVFCIGEYDGDISRITAKNRTLMKRFKEVSERYGPFTGIDALGQVFVGRVITCNGKDEFAAIKLLEKSRFSILKLQENNLTDKEIACRILETTSVNFKNMTLPS